MQLCGLLLELGYSGGWQVLIYEVSRNTEHHDYKRDDEGQLGLFLCGRMHFRRDSYGGSCGSSGGSFRGSFCCGLLSSFNGLGSSLLSGLNCSSSGLLSSLDSGLSGLCGGFNCGSCFCCNLGSSLLSGLNFFSSGFLSSFNCFSCSLLNCFGCFCSNFGSGLLSGFDSGSCFCSNFGSGFLRGFDSGSCFCCNLSSSFLSSLDSGLSGLCGGLDSCSCFCCNFSSEHSGSACGAELYRYAFFGFGQVVPAIVTLHIELLYLLDHKPSVYYSINHSEWGHFFSRMPLFFACAPQHL